MTCNCIEQIEAAMPEHKLDLAIFWNPGRSALTAQTYTSLLRRDTGRKETRSNKPRVFSHKFCPFCGVSMNTEPQADCAEVK